MQYNVTYAHKTAVEWRPKYNDACFASFFNLNGVRFSKYLLEPKCPKELAAWFFGVMFSEAPPYIQSSIEWIKDKDSNSWVVLDRQKLNDVETFAVLTLCRYVRDKVSVIKWFKHNLEVAGKELSKAFYEAHTEDENSGHSLIYPCYPYANREERAEIPMPTFAEGWNNLRQYKKCATRVGVPPLWNTWATPV